MYYPMGLYSLTYNWTYILVIIGAILSMAASAHVNSTFRKYSSVCSGSGITGAMAAQEILRRNNIGDVSVQHIPGELTDNYNPAHKTVNLSDSVYGSGSVAAIGVAAHECGHVMQHADGYIPLSIRAALVPAANFGSKLGMPIIIVGLFMGSMGQTFITLGIWMFSLAVLFQLVTLPVEFDASRRALAQLENDGILSADELVCTKKVLSAAALTYVAAAAASILQLLRLILLFGGNRRRD
ncbi:MAG: zinc metallopeptidase [Lachnospiraceae bacterium]|nr:zinc metallopeptidase [Lachnospiraceae bacterium]